MRAFLKWGTLGLCVVAAVFVWAATSHDDAFDATRLLTADADELKATQVTPHQETRLDGKANVLWCGTFQLTWNELCSLVGEDLHFTGGEPEAVAVLNRKSFGKDDLDSASYVAVADYVRNGVYDRIDRELQAKFAGQARPTHLPRRANAPRPQDIVGYAYLFKNLEFATPFERIDEPIAFDRTRVTCFGIGEKFKPGHTKLYPQVRVLDYQSPDDFTVELRTRSTADRVILRKAPPRDTLRDTIAEAERRITQSKPTTVEFGDVLKAPKLNFDITRRYQELLGAKLAVKNPNVAKDLQIVSAEQNVRFQMDERGVKLKSESHISFGCSAEAPPRRNRTMIFDKPFLLMLKREGAKTPYFALWVGNAELLVHAD